MYLRKNQNELYVRVQGKHLQVAMEHHFESMNSSLPDAAAAVAAQGVAAFKASPQQAEGADSERG